MQTDFDDMTLEEAKEWLRARFKDGAKCPCCHQHVKLSKRKLNTNMMMFLISLNRLWLHRQEWISYLDCTFKGRDYNYLLDWELAECALNEDKKKSRSGLWRPTKKGQDFLAGLIEVPSHAFTYNNKVVRFSETMTTVKMALGEKFDFQELMLPVFEDVSPDSSI